MHSVYLLQVGNGNTIIWIMMPAIDPLQNLFAGEKEGL